MFVNGYDGNVNFTHGLGTPTRMSAPGPPTTGPVHNLKVDWQREKENSELILRLHRLYFGPS